MKKRFTYDKPRVGFGKAGFTDNLTGESYEFTIDQTLNIMNKVHEEWVDESKKDTNLIQTLRGIVHDLNVENKFLKHRLKDNLEFQWRN